MVAKKLLMKSILALVAAGFAIYAGLQAELIAQVGVIQNIPQLEGDGAGNFIFAVLCLLCGVLIFIRPLLAFISCLLATVVVLYVGFAYQDTTSLLWTIVPIGLAISTFVLDRFDRKKGKYRRYKKHGKQVAVSMRSGA